MNDATLWNSGKTARQACYSVPFIDGEIWKYVYQFCVFCAIMMCTVSENQNRFRKPLGRIVHGSCFLADNV